MLIESPDGVKAEGSSHININRFTFDLSDRTMSVIALAIAMLALGLSILAITLGSMSERESRLAQQDAMLLKASVIAHGIPVDEDQLHGKENDVTHNNHHSHK